MSSFASKLCDGLTSKLRGMVMLLRLQEIAAANGLSSANCLSVLCM